MMYEEPDFPYEVIDSYEERDAELIFDLVADSYHVLEGGKLIQSDMADREQAESWWADYVSGAAQEGIVDS